MTIRRKAFIAAGAGVYATIGTIRYPAGAAEFNFKLGTDAPADQHYTRRLIEAAAKIKAESGGRLEIAVFPNNQLGNEVSLLLQVRSGAIELTASSGIVLADIAPVAGMSTLPFLFASAKEALSTMAGPFGRYVRSAISKINVYPFEQDWSSGFRQMVNSVRPIVTPEDLRGLKIRSPISPVVTALFRAFGASPTPLGSNDMYVALQTHVVDGVELPLPVIVVYKIYEVQKYVSYTNHIWTSHTILANADAWQRLPRNLRDLAERYINQGANLDNADVPKLEAEAEGTLRNQGMIFNRPNLAPFRAVVQRAGLYSQWRESYGPQAWTLLEHSLGRSL